MKLSKIMLASAVALSAATSALAQVHVGVRGNIGYTSFWNTDISNSRSEIEEGSYRDYKYEESMSISGLDDASGLGFGFGVALAVPLAPAISLQPELMFSHRTRSTSKLAMSDSYKEWHRDSETNDPWELYDEDFYGPEPLATKVELSQWFIDIPVMFRYAMPNGVFFNAGPVVSINLSNDAEVGGISIPIEIDDFFATFSLAVGVGGGYSVALGNGSQLDIDVRLNFGLTHLVGDDVDFMGQRIGDLTEYGNPKDFNILAGVTYWFM
ncbi:MAG: PorT family protein [Fibrobacter sp.]|nr:PorT family protein [Fibrobacter sp.]